MDFIRNTAEQAGRSLVGNAERAVIEVIDRRKVSPQYDESNKKKIAGFSMKEIVSEKNGFAISSPVKKFYVQFNPKELSISAQGGGFSPKMNYGGKDNQLEYGAVEVSVYLNVQLIFDCVNNHDAFMNEKAVLNPTTIAMGAGKAIVNTMTNREYTVQPQVEGFIAAINNPQTRQIKFSWGDLSYAGVINSVNSQYTMFSVSGKPIRASMNLGIRCMDKNVASGTMGQWQTYYEKAFCGDGAGRDLNKAADKIGNLLNISY